MDGCTVKQEFASDSKMMTSLSSKAHLENIKHCVLITVLLRHLKFQYDIKRAKEKALKVKHNQFNHTPKNGKIYSVKKLYTTQSQAN